MLALGKEAKAGQPVLDSKSLISKTKQKSRVSTGGEGTVAGT